MILDKKKILEYQQNKDPYLFVDCATEIIPGKSAKGYKKFNESEWYFKVHWPSDPNVPGMLQIEALVQMSSLTIVTLPNYKNKILYLTGANNLKFYKKIIPGMTLNMETLVKSFKRGIATFEAKGYVDKILACQANFTLILPEEIKKYNLKK